MHLCLKIPFYGEDHNPLQIFLTFKAMSPQLTLQKPLQIPPQEIPSYLEQLWTENDDNSFGANTFCLLIWQPAWIEQQLTRTGNIKGPITGTHRPELIEAAREIILENHFPIGTTPFDQIVTKTLSTYKGKNLVEDLRGQHIDSSISALMPRRLITLAPTIHEKDLLETLVAAYCPLPEEGSGNSTCGDVVVLRGGLNSLDKGLEMLEDLLPKELPSWLWWNGNLDEATNLFNNLALSTRRLILDSAIGKPYNCLKVLHSKIKEGQAVNDLNWLRLRAWRETLAMVFDPPERREALINVKSLDIDIQGDHPVQGLLLAAWIADRLNWKIHKCQKTKHKEINAEFIGSNREIIKFHLVPLPIGSPNIHPGEVVGMRLICNSTKNPKKRSLCVILGAESGECMRLEAGGMASMELIEEVVPNQNNSVEMDVARLLSSSRGSTSPLLEVAAPIAHNILSMAKV